MQEPVSLQRGVHGSRIDAYIRAIVRREYNDAVPEVMQDEFRTIPARGYRNIVTEING